MLIEGTWCCVNEKNCCSKWVPTPFSLQTKKYLAQEKLYRMAQHTKIQFSLIKWWNGWHMTLLVLRYQYEWPTFPTQNGNTTEKIKGRYKNKKLCCHKCVPIRNLMYLFAHFWLEIFKCNLRWIKIIVGNSEGQMCLLRGGVLILVIHCNTGELCSCERVWQK